MALTLQKGGNLSLSKTDPSLTKIIVGLGWDPRATDGAEFDLDASVFLLGSNDKVRSDSDFIFYNQLKSPEGAVEHTGDNRTGAGEGDDEVIKVDLTLIPSDIEKIAFAVTIHEADARKQNFGQVSNSFIRLVNETTGAEVVRYDLSEDASTETAMIFAEIYHHNNEWKFRAIGQGYAGGLRALANNYGINI
ncbi:TerD family protein [Candidatus Nitrosacidococcus tergens]|uniref:Tellurium resistance protein n=1 Tax=Candidatus Nitrosacidococcus tergens TaxID=553981 RepID=A0A7G1QAC7_9GAMM|nr:TerD family protein [Candidatus Nitrosacidococcus tergens]CAB1275913.1 tellurium resistance protein [Candidatus Nitrosacidococcus tergens]